MVTVAKPAQDSTLEIIVDYNNVEYADRRVGLRALTERILSVLGAARVAKHKRILFRLYDGWYEQQSLTRVAQDVSADIQANAPYTHTVLHESKSSIVVVNIEIAYTLRTDRSTHLWHTFRPKAIQRNIGCHHPSTAGCQLANCSLHLLSDFVTKKKCPEVACGITPQQLLVRNEQKLVDTMMATDLFSLHLDKVDEAVVVTTDDDLLPAMIMLVKSGTSILHVLTRSPGHSLSLNLHGLDRSKYTQLQM